MAGPSPDNLIWIDLEMTGLDPDCDTILEIATVVTDSRLETVAEGPALAIHHDDDVLARMDEWNRRHHGASGLIDRVRASEIDMGEAERLTLDFLRAHVPEGASPMCGNSICQDRRFLARWMTRLDSAHRALDDIRESIRELRHYRDHFLRVTGGA